MPKLFPHTDEPEPRPFSTNAAGQRIFRVTRRLIDQQTGLYIANTPEDAIADDATLITTLSREAVNEVVECIELMPYGPSFHAPGERR